MDKFNTETGPGLPLWKMDYLAGEAEVIPLEEGPFHPNELRRSGGPVGLQALSA